MGTGQSSRDVWRPPWLSGLGHDVRIAIRTFRLTPAFAAVAILSLALGTGANTAIFQLLNAIRLRSLPVAAPDELIELRLDDMTHARGTWFRDAALTNPLWEEIRRHPGTFTGLFAWADEPLEVSQSGEFRKAAGLWVSGDFFRVLGIQPLLGRLFTAADDHRGCGQGAGVVISYGFWQREFGGNPAVVGQETTIGNYRTAIIGVTPQTGLKPYDPLSLTIAGLSLAAVAAAASFIPAWRASSVDPVTALRQD